MLGLFSAFLEVEVTGDYRCGAMAARISKSGRQPPARTSQLEGLKAGLPMPKGCRSQPVKTARKQLDSGACQKQDRPGDSLCRKPSSSLAAKPVCHWNDSLHS